MPQFTEIFEAQLRDCRVSQTTALNEMARAIGWTVLRSGDSIRLDHDAHSIVISGLTWSKPDLEVHDELAAGNTQAIGSRLSLKGRA